MGLMWFLGFRDTNLKSPLQLFFHSQTHISNSKSYLLAWKVFKFGCKSHKIFTLSIYLSRVSRSSFKMQLITYEASTNEFDFDVK